MKRFPWRRMTACLRDPRALLCPALAAAALLGLTACGGEPLHPSKWKDPAG